MPPTCSIGADFGTESGRLLLLDLGSGEELATAVVPYPNGVIDRILPGTDTRLGADWALQDPADWVHVIETGIPALLRAAPVAPERIVGLGIDVTSCTVLPTDTSGTPLCQHARWRSRPHAWPKLWKHHAAQGVADRLTAVAAARGEEFLARYGGRISSEWYFPKLIELWLEDREIYEATSAFLEATDWIVWWLTGTLTRQRTTAGYKAMWSRSDGLPDPGYFDAAYPGFPAPEEKLGEQFVALGTPAGRLRPELTTALGLPPELVVAVGNVDSFVSVPGSGVTEPGTFVVAIGTSICSMVLAETEVRLPGITGVAADGILPGLYGYEAGQAAVGDMLAWLTRTLLEAPGSFGSLEAAAAAIPAGACGLVVLDWFNGNRSILADADLSGTIIGLTLQSSRAELYRGMLEAIGFGNRRIIENFTDHSIAIDRIVANGGIARASPLMMQLLADTSGLTVTVPDSAGVPARGAALFGAVAAGAFTGIEAAVAATRPAAGAHYVPDPEAAAVYDRVYDIYRRLTDLLGVEHAELMHRLKAIAGERRHQ
ncbi:ribulokinase [Conexibacter sp. DBS9H8]|uniref:ribulokinase n=1 Tax=Conexibacter sp. DBS9H8 TaxID=2937801 RepID=UPI00200C5BE3|nr:ribulokinase [Conexibacter sp. DBS9H8]